MKKRTLTKEQLQALKTSVGKYSAKDILYMGKIVPNTDDPRVVAKYFAQEFFECFPAGAESLAKFIKFMTSQEVQWNEGEWRVIDGYTVPERQRRFFAQMLIALGEYLLNGQPLIENVDLDAAKIIRLHPTITVPKIISELEKLYPSFTRDALEKRVRRLLKSIPREILEPQL